MEEAIENIKEAIDLYLEDAGKDLIQQDKTHKDRYLIPVQVFQS